MRKLLMLLGILMFVGIAGIAKADIVYINTLPYEITSPGYYILNISVSNFDPSTYGVNYAIKISASNVVLDGAGNVIDGDDSGVDYGIYAYSGTNITVKNVIVAGWYYGIYYEYVQNGNIINVTANSNTHDGIVLAYSNYSTLVNTTANYNSVSGFRLRYSNYNILLNNNASNNYGRTSGIDIYYSHGNNLIGNIVSSNKGYGISVISSLNNNLTSNLITSNDWGIILSASSKNSITNNTILGNTWGVYLYSYSNNNTIANNIISGGVLGIYLGSSNYNTVIKNTIQSYTGIKIYPSSQQNSLVSNTIKNAGDDGIKLYSGPNDIIGNIITNSGASGIDVQSSNNRIINNTISHNKYSGIMLKGKGNVVAGNRIYDNGWGSLQYHGGIRIRDSGNFIYNNFFNNTVNVKFDASYQNFWNTTKTLGRNIIGGLYIGGNVWFKPDGTGFSETCADKDSDGICDDPFIMNSVNIDYLPLAFLQDSVPPSVVIVYPENTTYSESITSIKVNVTDNSQISEVIAEVDGEYNITLVFDGVYYINTTVNIGEGQHWIRIYAYDTYGNANSTEIVYFTVKIPHRTEGQFLSFSYFYYLRYIKLLQLFNESYTRAISLGINNGTLTKVLTFKTLAEKEWQLAWSRGSPIITSDVRAFIHLRKAYLYLKEAETILENILISSGS
ncbi:NosD domain-containing protein [Thermococcus barophilus]|uniref:Periplasmic copper-binding protein NosD beta helix domain-containing protein n=1 Tax=Thermococcus barophilus TaxID=55802 RepID=A0A0S1XBR9_THEBA|nr:NosD domain-containing protein [Thermococcus barophilus]ALM75215.1 exported hypothetical protein [Thermococcus barophilus]